MCLRQRLLKDRVRSDVLERPKVLVDVKRAETALLTTEKFEKADDEGSNGKTRKLLFVRRVRYLLNVVFAAVEEMKFSGQGWKEVPHELFLGKEAVGRLNKLLILNLSNNKLAELPYRDMLPDKPDDTTVKIRAAEKAFFKTASGSGDLLYYCRSLMKLDLSRNELRRLPVRCCVYCVTCSLSCESFLVPAGFFREHASPANPLVTGEQLVVLSAIMSSLASSGAVGCVV